MFCKNKKIYTKIRIDMTTGETLEEEFFEYSGPVALCEETYEGGGWGDPDPEPETDDGDEGLGKVGPDLPSGYDPDTGKGKTGQPSTNDGLDFSDIEDEFDWDNYTGELDSTAEISTFKESVKAVLAALGIAFSGNPIGVFGVVAGNLKNRLDYLGRERPGWSFKERMDHISEENAKWGAAIDLDSGSNEGSQIELPITAVTGGGQGGSEGGGQGGSEGGGEGAAGGGGWIVTDPTAGTTPTDGTTPTTKWYPNEPKWYPNEPTPTDGTTPTDDTTPTTKINDPYKVTLGTKEPIFRPSSESWEKGSEGYTQVSSEGFNGLEKGSVNKPYNPTAGKVPQSWIDFKNDPTSENAEKAILDFVLMGQENPNLQPAELKAKLQNIISGTQDNLDENRTKAGTNIDDLEKTMGGLQGKVDPLQTDHYKALTGIVDKLGPHQVNYDAAITGLIDDVGLSSTDYDTAMTKIAGTRGTPLSFGGHNVYDSGGGKMELKPLKSMEAQSGLATDKYKGKLLGTGMQSGLETDKYKSGLLNYGMQAGLETDKYKSGLLGIDTEAGLATDKYKGGMLGLTAQNEMDMQKIGTQGALDSSVTAILMDIWKTLYKGGKGVEIANVGAPQELSWWEKVLYGASNVDWGF